MGIRQSEALVESEFTVDSDGNPTGGETWMAAPDGTGASLDEHAEGECIFIKWQDGIVGPDGQNGAFVEDVIEAARQRLRFFNEHPKFRCRENSLAITKLEEALGWLDWRTRQRSRQLVENTYQPHSES